MDTGMPPGLQTVAEVEERRWHQCVAEGPSSGVAALGFWLESTMSPLGSCT